MASFNCDNCGFTGERLASGACPRCGHVPAGFRVPPLPAPAGQVATEVEPSAEAPPGGYLDLDLGDAGKDVGAPQATPAPGAPRRRTTSKSAPAFAAVAPKEVPGSAKSILPIVLWVGVACVVLILVGVFFSRGGDETAASAPASPPVAAAPAPAQQPPAPAAAPEPAPIVPAAAATPETQARTVSAKPEPRAERRTVPPPRPTRGREPAVQVAAAPPAPTPAPAAQPAAIPAAPPQRAPAAITSPPPPPAVSSAPSAIEDAPRYATEGYRRPTMTEPGCVQRSIRPPRDLAERLDGPVTIRFAVGPDGDVSLFQIMGDVPDPRLPEMLETAVRKCAFTPGADAQGKPARMWVTMPIRFAR
ncbi:MAG: TonB family protein [Anaeromyxobacteraceae bacterium]